MVKVLERDAISDLDVSSVPLQPIGPHSWANMRLCLRRAGIGPDWRLVAVASPDQFASRDKPHHPRDLVVHRCINMRQETSGGLYAWEFEKDGRELRVRVDGQITFNNNYAMIDAAISGYGIAYVPESIVERQMASGELVQILDDWSPLFDGYFLYYPSHRQNLPAFQVIVDALRHRSQTSSTCRMSALLGSKSKAD